LAEKSPYRTSGPRQSTVELEADIYPQMILNAKLLPITGNTEVGRSEVGYFRIADQPGVTGSGKIVEKGNALKRLPCLFLLSAIRRHGIIPLTSPKVTSGLQFVEEAHHAAFRVL
jgi:hypothetical protein